MDEKIICAAVLLEDGRIFYGHRHTHCLEALSSQLSWTLNRQQISALKKEQGFVTTHNRFVGREEALQIALAQNQIKDLSQIRGTDLYSEDLY